MPTHEPKPGPQSTRPSEHRFGLSLSQLVASALAAASAAFGASYLGVAGTIIGAAIASVIATVASAMYTSSLERSRAAVRRTATQWSRTTSLAPVVDPNAPQPGAPVPDADHAVRRTLPWARLTVAAAAVLAVTLGVLSGVEGILGRPIASVVGGSDATGTSLGALDRSGSSGGKSRTTITPTPTPTPAPTPSTSPTTEPTGTPTTDPTETPAPPTGTSSTSPTAEPTGSPAVD